jgi:mono/diheme cytochrome c family protein
MNRLLLCVLALCVTTLSTETLAAEDAKPQEKTTYTDHVRPILREYCFSCHNQNKAQNDLKVDSYETLMEGGASGAVIEPGDLDSSWLWDLINHNDQPNMPPNADKLPADKLALIQKWIEGGALKDSGSKAVVKKQPTMDLSLSAGAGKPEGTAAMPEGLSKLPVVVSQRAGASTGIATSPWAPLAAVAGQHQISLYHTDSNELLGILPFPEGIPYALRFSRSGALLLAGGGRAASLGIVVAFDVRTGQRVFQVGDELDAVLAADVTADNALVALGGPEKIVRVFTTADGELAYDIRKHTDWIMAVEFSPDGVLLATGDRSAGLAVWEADTGREFYLLNDHKGAINDVSWRSDSNMLASASEDGTIKLWDMNSGTAVKSIDAHPGGVAAIDFTQDGRLVSCGRDGLVRLWDVSGKKLMEFPRMPDLPLEVALTHDGNRVIAGDFSGQTVVWNTSDGKSVGEMPANPQPPKEEPAAKPAEPAAAPEQPAAKAEEPAAKPEEPAAKPPEPAAKPEAPKPAES